MIVCDESLMAGEGLLERVRYFPRQLITPADLTQAQDYIRARLRRHNRMLHGWGVVCGCEVKATPDPWTVMIEPGYVLGPQGDEILIEKQTRVDISRQDIDGNAGGCGEEMDPWCSNVRVHREAGDIYIAVAYAEFLCRPVRVQPAGCGCEGSQCEYSRVREGFVVRVLDKLPTSHANQQPPGDNPFKCAPTGVRPCPDYVSEPWVVLAKIRLRDAKIRDSDIDNTTHRRYVASLANWWVSCAMLKVGRMRILNVSSVGEIAGFQEVNNIRRVEVNVNEEFNAIEVEFVGALVDLDTIKEDHSFIVTDKDGDRIPGKTNKQEGSNTVRLILDHEPIAGDYQVRLVGEGPFAIRSQQGRRLDGDPSGLPSGDGQEGGDFVFTLKVVQ